MEFTFKFLELFYYICLMMGPILSFLMLIITIIGQIVGRREGWTRFDALYWSFITATTVGYGDIYPEEKLSRVLAVFIAFSGLIFSGILVAAAIHSATEAIALSPDAEQIQNTIDSITEDS